MKWLLVNDLRLVGKYLVIYFLLIILNLLFAI